MNIIVLTLALALLVLSMLVAVVFLIRGVYFLTQAIANTDSASSGETGNEIAVNLLNILWISDTLTGTGKMHRKKGLKNLTICIATTLTMILVYHLIRNFA